MVFNIYICSRNYIFREFIHIFINFYKEGDETIPGKITTTYKFLVYDRYFSRIQKTTVLYNQVLMFYYEILLSRLEWISMSNYELLRRLEVLTIGTKEMKRDGKKPEISLKDYFNHSYRIPLYFRRAAINQAICFVRSYQTSYLNWGKNRESFVPARASAIQSAVVLYQGMYRNLTERSVEVKLFDGTFWRWVKLWMSGRTIPPSTKILSPSLVLNGNHVWLHIPVEHKVMDIRNLSDRLKEETKFFAVSFPGGDCMAAGVILDFNGKQQEICYLNGGAELKTKRNRLLKQVRKIQKSRKDTTGKSEAGIYKRIEQLNELYTHRVSRQLVNFCLEHQIKLIVVASYKYGLDFNQLRYLKTDVFQWQGRKIIRQLKYKAFQNGIIVSSVAAYHISDCCSKCGGKLKKYNPGHIPGERYFGGKLFLCSKGHRGNSAINAAINIGQRFLQKAFKAQENNFFEIKIR